MVFTVEKPKIDKMQKGWRRSRRLRRQGKAFPSIPWLNTFLMFVLYSLGD